MSQREGPWLTVEIIDVFPTSIGHCPHFNLVASELSLLPGEFCDLSDQTLQYPKHVIEAHTRCVRLIQRLRASLQGLPVNVRVEMIEATSMRGLAKALRYRLRGQMALVLNGCKVCDGYPREGVLEEAVRDAAAHAVAVSR